ncbi:MAG: hypothetical protein WC461_02005 [Candidatus Paceibacterota bacterium]
MTKWLRKIAAMVQEIPESFKFSLSDLPEKEAKEEEKGKLSEEMATLFKVLHWLKVKAKEAYEDHAKVCATCDPSECEEFRRRTEMAEAESEIVKNILFFSIREELGLNVYDYPSVGIRKDGVIVAVSAEEDNGIGVDVISVGVGLPPELAEIFSRAQGENRPTGFRSFLEGLTGKKPH